MDESGEVPHGTIPSAHGGATFYVHNRHVLGDPKAKMDKGTNQEQFAKVFKLLVPILQDTAVIEQIGLQHIGNFRERGKLTYYLTFHIRMSEAIP